MCINVSGACTTSDARKHLTPSISQCFTGARMKQNHTSLSTSGVLSSRTNCKTAISVAMEEFDDTFDDGNEEEDDIQGKNTQLQIFQELRNTNLLLEKLIHGMRQTQHHVEVLEKASTSPCSSSSSGGNSSRQKVSLFK